MNVTSFLCLKLKTRKTLKIIAAKSRLATLILVALSIYVLWLDFRLPNCVETVFFPFWISFWLRFLISCFSFWDSLNSWKSMLFLLNLFHWNFFLQEHLSEERLETFLFLFAFCQRKKILARRLKKKQLAALPELQKVFSNWSRRVVAFFFLKQKIFSF